MLDHILFWLIQSVVLLFGISLGKVLILVRLRKEENRRKELDLKILEKKTEYLQKGSKIATQLKDQLYQARLQQEIDNITRPSEGS